MAAGDLDEAFFHEETQRFAAMDAADGFDVGARERLAIGDDGERFAGGGGKTHFLLAAAQATRASGGIRRG